MIVFATVGTTSFDTLVSSLCSLPSLSAMAAAAKTSQHRLRRTPSQSKHSQSSSPLVSAQLSTSTSPVAVPSAQSCSTSLLSCSSSLPSSSGAGDDSGDDNIHVELVIQYGTGTCPLSFLPPSLKQCSLGETDKHEIDDCDEGSTLLLIPTSSNNGTQQYHRLHMKWYRFQPSLVHDMERADIILCHAGAGTLLEALAITSKSYDINTIQLQRPKINAVINTSLMNNHQSELAEELRRRRHVHVTWDCISEWTTDVEAKCFWTKLDEFCPVPFVCSDRSAQRGKSCFQRNVDDVMGVNFICESEVDDLAKDKKDS